MNFNDPNHIDQSTAPTLHPYTSDWNTASHQVMDEDDSDMTPSYEDYNEFFNDYESVDSMEFQQGAFYDDYPDPNRFTKEEAFPTTENENNQLSLENDEIPPVIDLGTDASTDMETQSRLIWSEGNEWTLKREYFSFNQPSMSNHDNRQVTLTFNQKEWDYLNDTCERFGMPIEDYLECCALKIQPLPFAATNNHELWKRLLCFQDKLEQFETMLEFCSNDLKYNIFHSKDILHYWFCQINEAHDQLDTFFNLMYLFGRNNRTSAL